jgi:hypothetical protein
MANLGSIAVKYAPDGANPNLQVDLILQEALDTFTRPWYSWFYSS